MSTEDQAAHPGDELVDRWLAHRERTAEDPATRPRTYGIPRTQPADRVVAPVPAAAPVAQPVVEPVVEPVVAPADEPAEPTPVATAVATEVGIDLDGFEPVLTASARRALEQPEQRRGWRSRGRRLDDVAPAQTEGPEDPEVTEAVEEVEEVEAPEEEAATPPDHVGTARDVLDLLGAAPPRAPEPEPTTEPEPASPRAPRPARRPRAARLGTAASALRSGVERAVSGGAERPAAAAARPSRQPAPTVATPPPPVQPTAQPTTQPRALPTELHSPGGLRAATGLLLLLGLVATGVAGYVAYRDPTDTALGVAGVLGLLSAVIWAVRASTGTTRMSLQQGRLEIHSAHGRHVFDLANPHTPIEVRGRPGSRGWKVLFHRRAMVPFVVDSSMVDPAAFTEVLAHHRPDLAAGAGHDHPGS